MNLPCKMKDFKKNQTSHITPQEKIQQEHKLPIPESQGEEQPPGMHCTKEKNQCSQIEVKDRNKKI